MSESTPNWRVAATPHLDIREDRVSEALFAVNLSRAIARQGADEYRDPGLFFARTHLTRTLRSLIRDVLKTLRGEPGANSVTTQGDLQTNLRRRQDPRRDDDGKAAQ
jgi:predicted AAA+ superfamily ATPase